MKSTCFGKKLKRILGGIIICSLPFIYYACKPCNCNTPCPDDPTPTPTPTDTIPTTDTIPDTPIIDTTIYPDTIFVPWDMTVAFPDEETIIFYADKPGVKVILMDMTPIPHDFQKQMASWWWRPYRITRDELLRRRNLAPEKDVRGRGTFYARDFFNENETFGPGALKEDSADIANLGFKWEYVIPEKAKQISK